MLLLKTPPKGAKSWPTKAGKSKQQYHSESGKRFTSRLGVTCETTSLEWWSCAGEQIPQIVELFSNRNGDGVFREENMMLPMLTIALTVVIRTPVTVAACKWIADA